MRAAEKPGTIDPTVYANMPEPDDKRGRRRDSRVPLLRVLTGDMAGSTMRIGDKPIVIGRYEACGLRLSGSGISRQHARIERDLDNNAVIFDLKSTNGTYVNGKRIDQHVLEGGDNVRFGLNTEVKFEFETADNRRLDSQADSRTITEVQIDLTDQFHFLDRLRESLGRALRVGEPVSVILLELDDYELLVDRLGADATDTILVDVSDITKGVLRAYDPLARYEEQLLAVILSGSTERMALAVGERIRRSVEARDFFPSNDRAVVTVSVGIATYDPDSTDEIGDFLGEAEHNLQQAKKLGGNRCMGST